MAKNSPLFVDIGQGISIMVGLPTISTWSARSRPKNAKKGTFGYNTQTKRLEYWDGKSWFAAPLNKG